MDMGGNGVQGTATDKGGAGYGVSTLFSLWNKLETLLLAYFRMERNRKQCFWRISEANIGIIFWFLTFPEGNYAGVGVFSLVEGGMGLETGFAVCFFCGRREKCIIIHVVVSEIRYFCRRIEEISPKIYCSIASQSPLQVKEEQLILGLHLYRRRHPIFSCGLWWTVKRMAIVCAFL